MAGIICGTGSYIPEYTMDNNDIARLVETSDEWIRERTGVVKRHIIRDETTVSMAREAGRRALENGGGSPEEVGGHHFFQRGPAGDGLSGPEGAGSGERDML